MKEIFRYMVYEEDDDILKNILHCNAVAIVMVGLLFWPAIIFKPLPGTWGVAWLIIQIIFLFVSYGLIVAHVISVFPRWIKNLYRAVRFNRLFGFYLPASIEGQIAIRSRINSVLKEYAQQLNDSYEAEERMKLELRNCDDQKNALALERNLRQNKTAIRQRRKQFYSRRDLVKKLEFGTRKSFKDYLTTK